MGKKKQKTVTPVIMGVHPTKESVTILHFPPQVASINLHNILEDYKKENVPEQLLFLFEDITTIVDWAIPRMRMVAPKDLKKDENEASTDNTAGVPEVEKGN